jgi:hypothetical protein
MRSAPVLKNLRGSETAICRAVSLNSDWVFMDDDSTLLPRDKPGTAISVQCGPVVNTWFKMVNQR